jgi:hypothetical protein
MASGLRDASAGWSTKVKIGYGKIGRTMNLDIKKCGAVGGDHEPIAVLIQLATDHPDDDFWILGRNSGEDPVTLGYPSNVYNAWQKAGWHSWIRDRTRRDIGDHPGGLSISDQCKLMEIYAEVTLPTFKAMDAHIWWVGQHGSTNMPIPRIDNRDELTKPQDWCAYYASFIFQGINAWRDQDYKREEIYLNADPRNRHKMRDLKWPLQHPVLTQYAFTNRLKHERYGDSTGFNWFYGANDVDVAEEGMHTSEVWKSTVKNAYSRLEMCSLVPETPSGDLVAFDEEWTGRSSFGLFINEARATGIPSYVTRKQIMHDWVMPLEPDFIRGEWSEASNTELQQKWGIPQIRSLMPADWDQYYPLLHSVRSTFTTPSSGSGWATTKPWEAFAAGTVCFFHPAYDIQNNILSDAPQILRRYLRVQTPTELHTAVRAMDSNPQLWWDIVSAQRDHFEKAITEKRYLRMIEKRVWNA